MFAQYIYSGSWDLDGYSEIGFIYQQKEILPFNVISNEHVFPSVSNSAYLNPETDYWLALLLRTDGIAVGYLQDSAYSLPLYKYEYTMDPSFHNLVWETGMSAQHGVITIDEIIRFNIDK